MRWDVMWWNGSKKGDKSDEVTLLWQDRMKVGRKKERSSKDTGTLLARLPHCPPLISHWVSPSWCVCVCVCVCVSACMYVCVRVCEEKQVYFYQSSMHYAVLWTLDTGITSWLSTICSTDNNIMSYNVTWRAMLCDVSCHVTCHGNIAWHITAHPCPCPLTWLWLWDGIFKGHGLPHFWDAPCLLRGCLRTAAYHAHCCSLLLLEPFSFPHSLWGAM